MKFVDLVHRWSGAIVGMLLATIALTGVLLALRHSWISAPGAQDGHVGTVATLAQVVDRVAREPGINMSSIIFANEDFGLNEISYVGGGGAYADSFGTVVAEWHSRWERPELWLFDLHHQLLAGDTGATVVGSLGVMGLIFVMTGGILWWRTRRTYKFRIWPKRFTRPALIRHHRDLGIIALPLLVLTFATGAMLVFRPLTAVVLGASGPDLVDRELAPPADYPARTMGELDWRAMLGAAQARFPEAQFRSLAFPQGGNGMIRIRMKQPEEWLPNGRTILWFAADTGALIEARDSRDLSFQTRAYNGIYPIHAGEVGGWWWRAVVISSGFILAMLGLFATWSFWSFRLGKGGRNDSRGAPPRRQA